MTNNESTKDFILSKNERLYDIKNYNTFFKFPINKNFISKYVKFYAFHTGFKKKSDDLLLAIFREPIPVAAVYSKTSTPSAPIIWDKKNNNGFCKILIVNSGNANAHTGKDGIKAIDKYVLEAAKYFDCKSSQILVSSTGVIGEKLDFRKIIKAYPLVKKESEKNILSAAKAIMTTDTFPKLILKKIKIFNENINIFGIAKGSGMIFPNMGTMLSYIFIEANLTQKVLKNLLKNHLDDSFNSISVDGDTSTSDTVMLFSLIKSKNRSMYKKSEILKISLALKEVMQKLALHVVSDGEGISKLMEINVKGALTYKQASLVAFSVGNSPLVKTAIAGQDPNWGRIIMAIGKSNTKIIQNKIKLKFGNIVVAKNGQFIKNINYSKLNSYMKKKQIQINIDLGLGIFKRRVYSSDLTHEYVRINADYRS